MRTALISVLLILVACSQGDKNIDQLIVAFDNAPRSFDPRFATDANSQYLTNLVHCSLIEYTPEGGYRPQLAKDLKWLSDTKLRIKLKEKVRFSNSKPLTSKDVKATFDFFINHAEKTPRAASFKGLKSIEAPNAREVVFNFHKADASFVINNLGVGIMPKTQASGEAIKEPKNIIGCGPYLLEDFKTHEIKLTKNGKFFLKDRVPRKDQLVIKIVKDEGTRFLKLRKGEVHLVQNVSREKIANLKEYPELSLVKKLGLNTAYLAFNMRDEIVGNPKVREAIAYAIDRQSIIKHVLKGMAQVASNLLTPNSEYANSNIGSKKLDLDKAMRLLDEAGFSDPDGDGPKPRLSIRYKTTTDRTRVTIAKAIVTQLSKIGIHVELQSLEWGKFKKDVEGGKAQMWSLKWVGFKDPDILHYIFHSSNHSPLGGNRGFYTNTKLDSLLEQARATVDVNKRKKLYMESQEIIDRELPYINLWHEEVFAVMNNSLTGYDVYADGRYQSLPYVREKAK